MDRADVQRRITAIRALGLPCLLLIKLVLSALPIAQIAIGAVYLKDCPQQPYIPVYMLVCGVFSICLALPCCGSEESGGPILCYIWNALVSVFMFCWFISGSVWIYSIYPPSYNSTVPGTPYCHKTLYLFAFWTTTMTYIFLAGLLVAGCCVCLCMCVCVSKGQTAVPDSA